MLGSYLRTPNLAAVLTHVSQQNCQGILCQKDQLCDLRSIFKLVVLELQVWYQELAQGTIFTALEEDSTYYDTSLGLICE